MNLEKEKKYKNLEGNPFFETITCPLCSCSELVEYFKLPFSKFQKKTASYSKIGIGEDSIISAQKCRKCQFVFSNPRVKKEHQSKIYNDCKESDKNKIISVENYNSKKRVYVRALSSYLDNLKGKRVLDYGCGYGYSLNILKDWGIKSYGVDVSEARVSFCKESDLKAELLRDFDSIYPDLKFDFIFMQNNLEHILDLQETFDWIKRKCYSGTMLILDGFTPSVFAKEKKINKFDNTHLLEHVNFFPISSLDNYLKGYGFSPVKNYKTISGQLNFKMVFKAFLMYLRELSSSGYYPFSFFQRTYKYHEIKGQS